MQPGLHWMSRSRCTSVAAMHAYLWKISVIFQLNNGSKQSVHVGSNTGRQSSTAWHEETRIR